MQETIDITVGLRKPVIERGDPRGPHGHLDKKNTTHRHALWITLPGDRRSSSVQLRETNRRANVTVEEANNYRYFCFICDLNEYFYLVASHEWGKIWTISVEGQNICRHHGFVSSAEENAGLSYPVRYICKLTNKLLSAESFSKFSYLNDIFLLQDSASTSKKGIWNSRATRIDTHFAGELFPDLSLCERVKLCPRSSFRIRLLLSHVETIWLYCSLA